MRLLNAALKGFAAVGAWMAFAGSGHALPARPQPKGSKPEAAAPAASKASFDPVAATDAYLAKQLKPGPREEFIFFDHPGGYNRILMAMRWKAENLP